MDSRTKRTAVTRWLLLYGIPLVFGIGFLLWSGAEGLRYERSWHLIQDSLRLLAPEWAPPGDGTEQQLSASFYQLNQAFRRLAHVVVYAALALLTVRAIQAGQPRLKAASLWTTLLLGVFYTGLDEWHRALQPNRHAKWLDLYLNLAGVALVLVLVPLYFALKSWERSWRNHAVNDATEAPTSS